MISIIVPVYKAEKYLPKCLDSIVYQTFRDLDIILIDDGSPDKSGTICDQYAQKDSRIRVFHTPNQGVSGARNLGLEKALEKGSKYIGFVDSDDWVEPTMFEKLYDIAEENNGDVVVCSYFEENHGKQQIISYPAKQMDGAEAIRELVLDGLSNTIWNKLWKAEWFSSVHFTQGLIFEDVMIQYRVLGQIRTLIRIPDPLYHYNVLDDSISHVPGLPVVMNKWKSEKVRHDDILNDPRFAVDQDVRLKLDRRLERIILSAWKHGKTVNREQRSLYAAEFSEMKAFVKEQIPLRGFKGDHFEQKFITFLVRLPYPLSLKLAGFYNSVFTFLLRTKARLTGLLKKPRPAA